MSFEGRLNVNGPSLVLILAVAATIALAPGPGAAQTLPTLPQAVADTSVPTVNGSTFMVNAGGNLQNALTSAAAANGNLTHEIVLQAGATFTGPYTVPARSGSGAIVVRTSNLAGIPAAGLRATLAHVAAMPKIRNASAGPGVPGEPALALASNATRYWFVGIDFDIGPLPADYQEALVNAGGLGGASGINQIVFDRSLFRNTSNKGFKNALVLGGRNQAVLNSSFYNVRDDAYGNESHCVLVGEAIGPSLIQNNYLEGKFGVLIGGFGWNQTQQDITIRRNYFFKQAGWGSSNQKHFVEGKTGGRVLVEQNVVDMNGQIHLAYVLFYYTNFDGSGASVYDWTIRWNKFFGGSSVQAAVMSEGDYYKNMPESLRRIHIHNNLIYSVSHAFHVYNENVDITIEHNTADSSGNSVSFAGSVPGTNARFFHRSNIYAVGNPSRTNYWEDSAPGSAGGTAGLNAYWGSGDWMATNNLFVGMGSLSGYPSGDLNPSLAQVAFVNRAGADYTLAADSLAKAGRAYQAHDGTDNGANITALNAATAGVVSGSSGTTDTTPPNPPTGVSVK